MANNCFAIEDPIFQPAMRIIDAITNANPMQITTSFDNDYLDGAIVRLNIPVDHGMQQANQLQGVVTVTSGTTFTLPIDSTIFDTFSHPGTTEQCAQITPVGEINSKLDSAVRNTL